MKSEMNETERIVSHDGKIITFSSISLILVIIIELMMLF
jgi:hypothetical protein